MGRGMAPFFVPRSLSSLALNQADTLNSYETTIAANIPPLGDFLKAYKRETMVSNTLRIRLHEYPTCPSLPLGGYNSAPRLYLSSPSKLVLGETPWAQTNVIFAR